ncbi:MAG: hypothetical protein LBQ60_15915 [Bacteroidales bacterium]|jgi:C-terminal processing protease CtpA/Prc|nr:hypothetical protein [Bacteroidales bacterium]
MKKYLFLIVVFFLSACNGANSTTYPVNNRQAGITPPDRPDSRYITPEMKFETNAVVYNPRNCPSPYVSKWISSGNTGKDSINVAEGKYSLKLQNDCDVYYYLDAARIEGDSLIFSGKFKYSEARSGKLYFYILQRVRDESVEHPAIPDSLIINNISGNAGWDGFTIRAKLKPNIYEIRFGLKTENINKVWIDDWDIQVDNFPVYRYVKARYPAEEDVEFDKGSGITLKELTPEVYRNLDVLGRIWGFLKYYHPAIADGDINWDYELFRVLPKVANAKNKKELNQVLYNWTENIGDFPVKEYHISSGDSILYPCFADIAWINNKEMFTDDMISLLNKVKNAVRQEKVNYYMIPFGGGPRQRNFRAEKPYNNITWEDQGYRLLSLFRFWNVMEYNFPYKSLTDKPWTNVLTEYIPEVLSAGSEAEYFAAMMKAVAEINDSHGRLFFNGSLKGTPAERLEYKKYPVTLTETDNGEFCVEKSFTSELNPGDIILSVNGKPVKEIYNELAPYITASNNAALSRNLRPCILAKSADNAMDIMAGTGKASSLEAKINRGGQMISLELKQFSRENTTGVKGAENYQRENKDIIFLNLGTSISSQLVNAIENNMSAKGIIFDLRQYPRDFMSFFKLSDVLLPNTAINLWFSTSVLNYPGHYRKYNECPIGKTNPDFFKGKVAILVNEYTQSLGEMTAIALSNAPRAAVIGSTTSGADGNVTRFILPGGMTVSYTVIGAYYPDWIQCQRTGVKIDIHARPTADDLLNKKDVLIERAIQYINEK